MYILWWTDTHTRWDGEIVHTQQGFQWGWRRNRRQKHSRGGFSSSSHTRVLSTLEAKQNTHTYISTARHSTVHLFEIDVLVQYEATISRFHTQFPQRTLFHIIILIITYILVEWWTKNWFFQHINIETQNPAASEATQAVSSESFTFLSRLQILSMLRSRSLCNNKKREETGWLTGRLIDLTLKHWLHSNETRLK